MLNTTLNKLDEIIFHDYENRKDVNEIIKILNGVRIYIIDSTLEHNKEYNKRSFMVILEFVNYLIQESFHPTTNQFINHIIGLRLLIIKFKSNHLDIDDEDEKIDFNEKCNSFLNKYAINEDGKSFHSTYVNTQLYE